MPGPPPEHPHLRLLKGNPGNRPARSPLEAARTEQCPEPPERLHVYASSRDRKIPLCLFCVLGRFEHLHNPGASAHQG